MFDLTPPHVAGLLTDRVKRIDHIAIAVPDLEPALRFYVTVLGFRLVERRDTHGDASGMTSAVVRAGGATVVLVQGTEPNSQVSRFVERYGAGVQHVAFEVEDLPAAVAELRARGVEFETEVLHGNGICQAFTTRDEACPVRLELIERKGGNFDDRSVERLFRAMEARGAF